MEHFSKFYTNTNFPNFIYRKPTWLIHPSSSPDVPMMAEVTLRSSYRESFVVPAEQDERVLDLEIEEPGPQDTEPDESEEPVEDPGLPETVVRTIAPPERIETYDFIYKNGQWKLATTDAPEWLQESFEDALAFQ